MDRLAVTWGRLRGGRRTCTLALARHVAAGGFVCVVPVDVLQVRVRVVARVRFRERVELAVGRRCRVYGDALADEFAGGVPEALGEVVGGGCGHGFGIVKVKSVEAVLVLIRGEEKSPVDFCTWSFVFDYFHNGALFFLLMLPLSAAFVSPMHVVSYMPYTSRTTDAIVENGGRNRRTSDRVRCAQMHPFPICGCFLNTNAHNSILSIL
jgi:hypothetical protein